jgi:acyl dehydratase
MTPLMTLPATYKMPRGLPNETVYLNDFELGPLPSYEVLVTPVDVERWAKLHDDDSPWYTGESPWGGPVAPPTIFYYPSQSMIGRSIAANRKPGTAGGEMRRTGGGFARYRIEFLAPIPIGRPLLLTGKVVDKFVRRGLGYLNWEVEASSNGAILQRHLKSWTFDVNDEEAASLPERPGDPRVEETPPLEEFGGLQMEVGHDRTAAFEGPGEDNGHSNPEIGRRNGMPGARAQGELSFGLLYRLMRDRYREDFAVGGTMDVRFIRSVFTTEMLTALGEALTETGGAVTCRIRAENSRGEIVTVGTATALGAAR